MSLPSEPHARDAWRALEHELRLTVGDADFDIWLAPLQLESFDGQALRLSGPEGTRAWVSSRYGRALDGVAERVLGDGVKVIFTIAGRGTSASHPDPGRSPRTGATPTPPRPTPDESVLHPRYTFDQFVIGEGNRLAHAAALAVAELPGQAYNPLFIHAPPGLGKTHLLHSIGNYVLAYGGGARVRYTTAEAFTNQFVAAVAARSTTDFKRAYRDADVLLIDDIQFLASKTRTLEEFFHTFNELYDSGRQLVITCDQMPRALIGIEERLRERFEAGLVADIQPPDQATRVAILRKRAALDELQIADPSVLELIADRVRDNIRSLEGALIRVVAFHSLTGRQIDRELTLRVLDTMYPARGRTRPTIAQIQAIVAGHFKLTVEELNSSSRRSEVSWPRQIAIHLARDLTGASLPAIGQAFGGRNHATVVHACKRVAERLKDDPDAVEEISALASEVSRERADRDY